MLNAHLFVIAAVAAIAGNKWPTEVAQPIHPPTWKDRLGCAIFWAIEALPFLMIIGFFVVLWRFIDVLVLKKHGL